MLKWKKNEWKMNWKLNKTIRIKKRKENKRNKINIFNGLWILVVKVMGCKRKNNNNNNGLGLDIELGLDMGLSGWCLLKAMWSELLKKKEKGENWQ